MYAYEVRIRAVKPYFEPCTLIKAKIRQLDYPSKNASESLCKEYDRPLDLPMSYTDRELKCMHAQKEAAVEH